MGEYGLQDAARIVENFMQSSNLRDLQHHNNQWGPSLMKWYLKISLENTNIGGIVLPKALTAAQTVPSYPRSLDVTAPTCFTPF